MQWKRLERETMDAVGRQSVCSSGVENCRASSRITGVGDPCFEDLTLRRTTVEIPSFLLRIFFRRKSSCWTPACRRPTSPFHRTFRSKAPVHLARIAEETLMSCTESIAPSPTLQLRRSNSLFVCFSTSVVAYGSRGDSRRARAKRTNEDVLERKCRRSRFGNRKGRCRSRELRYRRGSETWDGCSLECDSSAREDTWSEAKVVEMDTRDVMGVHA